MPVLIAAFVSATLVAGLAGQPAAITPARGTPWAYVALENVLEATDLGIERPGALSWDGSAGTLVVSDLATGRARRVAPQGSLLGTARRADAPARSALSAKDPRTGHRYTLDLATAIIQETDRNGRPVSRRDVSGLRLQGVGGIAVAPTADTTDAPAATSLYVSVADATDGESTTGAGVLELALAEPVVSAALAAVPDHSGQLVKTIDTSAWNPFSPDPSGIAYVNPLAKLVVADGEIDEDHINAYPYHGTNVWLADPVSGAGAANMDTTTALPANREPVGAAYDPARDELYLSKDGSGSRVWVYSRTGDTFSQVRSMSLSTLGAADAEGIAFANNQLYIADGSNKEVWVIGAGPDNTVATSDDVVVSNFDTASLGLNDPEGIGIHPVTGNIWVLSRRDGEGMVEMTQAGVVVSTTHFAFPTENPGGLEIAPSSSTTDDPTVMSAWVAQRGVDNNDDPNENDGKVFEVMIQAGSPPPPPPDPGDNLLVNGDFETGSPGGAPPAWTTNAAFQTSNADAHGGSQSGRHQAGNNANYTIEQRVDAVAGTAYSFSTWANWIGGTDSFRVVFKVQWRSASRALSTVTIGKINKSSGVGWQELSRSGLVAPAGTTTARVFMVVASLNTTVYVDDISLAAGP